MPHGAPSVANELRTTYAMFEMMCEGGALPVLCPSPVPAKPDHEFKL